MIKKILVLLSLILILVYGLYQYRDSKTVEEKTDTIYEECIDNPECYLED